MQGSALNFVPELQGPFDRTDIAKRCPYIMNINKVSRSGWGTAHCKLRKRINDVGNQPVHLRAVAVSVAGLPTYMVRL